MMMMKRDDRRKTKTKSPETDQGCRWRDGDCRRHLKDTWQTDVVDNQVDLEVIPTKRKKSNGPVFFIKAAFD